jgi:hypothetical protein
MTFLEAATLATATGVLSMGLAAIKWVMHIETRLAVIEEKMRPNRDRG